MSSLDHTIITKRYGTIYEYAVVANESYVLPTEVNRFHRALTVDEGHDFGVVKCMDVIDCLSCGRTGYMAEKDVILSIKNLSRAVFDLMCKAIRHCEDVGRVYADGSGDIVRIHETVYLVNCFMCDGYPAPYSYSNYTGEKVDAYVLSVIDESVCDVDERYAGVFVVDMGDLF